MPPADAHEALNDLLGRVDGLRAALLLDAHGSLIAQAEREGVSDLPGLALACHRMARETLAAAERTGQGPVGQIALEAEGGSLLLLPGEKGRTLGLLLSPQGIPGQLLFEGRRLLAALASAT